jgi:hypothetical protein
MSHQVRGNDGNDQLRSVAHELKQASDNLRQLAEKLEERQQALSEMEANYPYFRAFVYARLRQEFERTLGELLDTDLETLARAEGGKPLEEFIGDLERAGEGA